MKKLIKIFFLSLGTLCIPFGAISKVYDRLSTTQQRKKMRNAQMDWQETIADKAERLNTRLDKEKDREIRERVENAAFIGDEYENR